AVDTAVVGQIPDPALIGGVALGAMIYTFVHAGFNFLRMGTTGPTAQAVGAARAGTADTLVEGIPVGGWGEVRNILARALILAGLLGIAVVALQSVVVWAGITLLEGSAAVEDATRAYLEIRLWSAPAALAMFAVIGWFYGLEDARIPLILQIVGNGLNIVLDLWFVLGLGWGVEGVAAATVIAEYAAILLGLYFVHRRLAALPEGEGRTRILDLARIARMMSVNRDIFIRTICLIGGLAIYRAMSAKLGDVALAANTILFQLVAIAVYAMDGFAHAAEALVGEAFGQRSRERVRRAANSAHLWGAVSAGLFAVFWFLVGGFAIDLFTVVEEVRTLARDYLFYAVVIPVVSIWAFTFDGIFLGATRNRTMRNAMIASFALYVGVLALLFPRFGNDG
ncbi:MAG: MATE family efflux transporter, partial [Pirellulales bacterium]|nr:MATE family efflux transporter [Pirellulales bacterium]